MDFPQSASLQRAFRICSVWFGFAVIIIGGLGFLGWMFGIPELKSIDSRFMAIKVNATIALVLSGIALILKTRSDDNIRFYWISQVCAAGVTIIGSLTFIENLSGWDLGIDQLIFEEPASSIIGTTAPGRMAPVTSLTFLLFGLALHFLDFRNDSRMSQVFGLIAWAVGYVNFTGYLYGIKSFSGISSFTQMAFHTTLALMLLGLGLLMARPERGLLRFVTGAGTAGILLRRLLPAAVTLSFLQGWLQVFGEKIGLFDSRFGAAALSVAVAAIFIVILFLMAGLLNRSEHQVQKALADLQKSEERLRLIFNSGSDAVFVIGPDAHGRLTKFLAVNDMACTRLEYTREELLTMTFPEIDHPGFPLDIAGITRQFEESGAVVFESVHRTKGGKIIPVEISTRLFKTDEGPRILSVARDISERKLAEKEYKTIQQTTPDGFFITDLNARFLEVNDTYCKITGYSRDELLRMGITDVEAQESPEDIKNHVHKMVTFGFDRFETRHRSKDGRIIDVEISAHYSDIRGGEFIVFVHDITDRKKNETSLLKFSRAVEQSPATIVITDVKGVIEYVNPAFTKITGFTMDEAIGKSPRILKSGLHPREFYRKLWGTILHGNIWSGEILNRNKNGELFWEDVSISPVKDDKGIITHFVGIKEDITERKKIEHELRKLSQAVHESNVSVVITNEKGDIQYVNPYFSVASGYSNQEVLDKNPRILKSEYHPVEYFRELWDTILAGKVWQGEFCNRRKNGELYWEQATLTPIKNPEGTITHLISIQVDITRLKQVQNELVKAKDAADAATRAKSDFLAHMTHELRTPLNAILGYTNLLSLQVREEPEKNYLQSIQSSGKSLLNLINDLLDLSKIEAGGFDIVPEDTEMISFLREIETLFTFRAGEKGLQLICGVNADVPPVLRLDRTRLRQVMINLVSNAIKFTEQGSVSVSIAVEEARSAREKAKKLVNLHLTVTDTGIGISPEFNDRIFQSFAQQDEKIAVKYGGTGLGLAISRKLVEAMGGEIGFTSEPGKGSVFHVTLKNIPISDIKHVDMTAQEFFSEKSTGKTNTLYQLIEAPDFNHEQILPVMESELLEKWQLAKDTNSVKDAELFAGAVLAAGHKYNAQFLIEYGMWLNQALSSFDVETLEMLKYEFPKIIEKIRNHKI
jgi:PAS domain S-box-containing protein